MHAYKDYTLKFPPIIRGKLKAKGTCISA